MLLAKNRKATFNHEILEKFMAGIILRGYEVKAIKEGKVNMTGSYITLIQNEPYVVNMHIGKYSKQSQNYDENDSRKSRKILITKNELQKLQRELSQKGKTAVPLALLLKHNLIKLEFAIVKGRKKHEKKIVAQERQVKKELDKAAKDSRKYVY
ncbi:MAG: SsrA-binding protein SmpB [Patescibacteria group bacterium]